MVARTAGRKGRPWRRVQARVYAEETHCWICGRWVNQALADYRCKDARSVHHLIPPDIAPHLAHARENLRLAHIGCNSTAGRGAYGAPRQQGQTKGKVSGVWGRRPRAAVPGQARGAVTVSDRDW